MKELDIVFTKSKNLLPIGSWLIRLWTMKPYSHCAIKFDTKSYFGTDTYCQASEKLVNYMSEPQFIKKHEIVIIKKITVPDRLYREIRKECHYEAGAPYGIMQNLGIVLVDVLNLFNIRIDNPFKSGRNCSELVYTKIIVPILGDIGYNPDTIKPHHIERIIQDSLKKSVL